jgi:SAM-dependent methyltransferase
MSGADRLTSAGSGSGQESWEAAYLRFETPRQEERKFVSRLRALGAAEWRKDAAIVDLFCGRGGGLRALESLGFTRTEGADLSFALVANYSGPARRLVVDCRELPFADNSKDILIVQGGLHHLLALPADLDRVLAEVQRVLVPDGRFVIVEPWLTPFLRAVHGVCGIPLARRVWPKLDALAVMIELERVTYEQWLAQPAMIRERIDRRFVTESRREAWGKLSWVGRKRTGTATPAG